MNDLAPTLSNQANAPLGELLAEETAAFRERAAALIEGAKASKIDSVTDAEAVTTLGNLMAELKGRVDEARVARARPFDEGKAAVQRAFAREIIDPLTAAMGLCKTMLDAWRRRLAQEAEAERRRNEAAAAEAQRAAEEAERKRLEAQQVGDTGAAIKAELEEIQARDRAEALTKGEGAILPDRMIRTQVGSALSRTERKPVVTDIGEMLVWMIVNQPAPLLEALSPLIARLVRAKVDIPGVRVEEVESTSFRR